MLVVVVFLHRCNSTTKFARTVLSKCVRARKPLVSNWVFVLSALLANMNKSIPLVG